MHSMLALRPDQLAIIGGIVIVLFAMGSSFFLAALKIIFGRSSRKEKVASPDETRLIQELHQMATRMEQRVESLETLVLDSERTKSRDFAERL